MQKGLSSNKTLYIGIALSVSLIIAIIFFSRRQIYKGNATTDLTTHSHKVLTAAEQVLKTVTAYEASTNYFAIAGQQQLLPQLEKSPGIITKEIAFLNELTTDNRIQNKLSDSLLFYAHELMRFNSSAIDTRKKDGLQSAAALLSSGMGKFYLANFSRLTAQLAAGENLIISRYRKEAANALLKEKILMLLFCFAILCLLIIIFWREIKNTVKREKNNSLEQLALLSHQINQSNDAIYTIDTSFKIKTWNKGAENLYGFSSREALGRNSHELLKTALTGKEVNDALNLVNQQNYWTGELKRKTKTGNDIYVQSSTTTIRDNAGHITGYVAVSFDITEKKKIREQMSHLAGMVEQSSEAIFSRGADQRLLTWNNGAEKLFGYSKEDIIGKTAKELGFIRLNQQEIMAMENQVLKTGSWASEMDYYRKDGSSFYGSVTANLIQNETGKSSAFYFIVKNISERKKLEDQLRQSNDQLEQRVTERTIDLEQSEKKYRYLFENNPLPMWVVDATTFKFLDVNETAVAHYGYSRSEFLDMTMLDLRPEGEKAAFLEIDRSLLTRSEINNLGVWNHVKKDGSIIQVEINIHQVNFGNSPAALTLVNDVTEKIKAQQILAASERRFKAMVENNEDIVTILDENKRLIYRSASATRIIGWTTEEFEKISLEEYFHPDYLEYMRESMKNALDNPGKIAPILTRVKHKAGHYIWLEGTINNLLHDKCVEGIITNVRDVTQRIQAKEKLASNEKRFRTLIENNRDVITLMDASFKLIYRSPAAARITGWSDEDMLDVDATRNIHPDDVEEARAIVRQLMANPGKQFTILFRNLHKNGHYIWMEGILTNWLHDKNVNAVVFNYHDVTERIAAQEKLSFSEKRFRALIENNYDVITLLDKNFKVFYRSPSAQRITGWSDEEMFESDGENKMSIHPDDRPKANVIMRECLANPGKPVYATYRNLHKNGHYIWLEGAVTNLLQDEYINAIVFNFRDITERVAIEDKLQSSEKRFRSMVENNKDIIMLMDEAFNVTYRSPSATEVSGWTDEEVQMMTALERIHPDDVGDVENMKQKLLANPDKSFKASYRIQHKNGHYIWLDGTATNFLADKNVNAILFNFRDITKQVEADKKIAASEKRFRSLIENISDAIVLNDAETNILYQSPSVTRILGYTPEERKKKKILDYIHTDDKPAFIHLYNQLANTTGVPLGFQYRFLHKNGKYIWLEGVVTNLVNDLSVNAYVANYRDITERKEAEETIRRSEKIYKTIASGIPGSMICLLDMEFRYLLVEGDFTEQLGYSKTSMLGNKVSEVLKPEIFELVKNDFEKAFNGEVVTREHRGTEYDTLSRFIPLKDENNAVYAVMTVTLDITNLKDAQRGIIQLNHSLEEKITKRTEELKRSNEELEAFSYSVSHDLRAPLRAVIGYTTILEEDYCNKLDDEAKRLTGIIKDNTVKMGNLIDGLLSFSRMGRHEIAKIKINQNLLVKSIITDVENKQKEEKRTKWILHSLPDINAESYTIKQVWINLISNAVKYSAKSPAPVIEIGSFKKNGQTAFFVRDNGVGFDEKYKTKLFKVFQRLHSSSDFEGTGIGLAIVEKIINKHGGNVWVEAEMDKGACFYFSVPEGQ